jgi:hypothetical protein
VHEAVTIVNGASHGKRRRHFATSAALGAELAAALNSATARESELVNERREQLTTQ